MKRFCLCTIFAFLFAAPALAQTITAMGGYCDTVSDPGQAFVLDQLGQSGLPTSDQCTYGPGSPNVSVLLGALVKQSGTLENLYVKQFTLNGADMGGTVVIWDNPKTGGIPVNTGLTCNLAYAASGIYTCHNTSSTYSVVAGDRLIAVVTPPAGESISPVTATINIATTTTATTPTLGYCGSVSYSTPFVLNGLGQMSTTNCTYGPGSPVQAWMGQVITKTGTLKNLYVKQQQLNSAPFGGTVNVWVNPRAGTSAVETSIACTLGSSGSLYTCNNTSASYSVSAGDQVIVIVTPPGGETVSPVTATVDVQ
ncbi:MAG: hypothetical protein WAL32_09105 [Terriglobales bacterium]